MPPAHARSPAGAWIPAPTWSKPARSTRLPSPQRSRRSTTSRSPSTGFVTHLLTDLQGSGPARTNTRRAPTPCPARKRAMLEQAEQSILMVDDSKLEARGRQALAKVSQVSLVLADGLAPDAARRLTELGATVRATST